MVFVQVAESLADELSLQEGCRVILPTRGAGIDVALEVLAAGSNVVTLILAPQGIRGSIEAIRSWLMHRPPETTVEIHRPSVDVSITLEKTADVDDAMAVIRAALSQADAH